MIARLLIAGVAALLVAVTVVRNAAVDALADSRPALASSMWSGHPAAEIGAGMAEIARAARSRAAVSSAIFRRIDAAARKAPLAAEPFLVAGVHAQTTGREAAAERAFVAAEWRDPRSLPAHYFLAEHYFRAGNAEGGLKEITSLARLSPEGIASSAPYIADFARNPANWPRLRATFRANPEMEDAALAALAHDASNTGVIFALSPPSRRNASSPWLPALLNSLVAAGDFAKAKAVWTSVSGIDAKSQSLLFDPGFSNPKPPAPFNWILTSSTVGLAERERGGRLHAIYYGQEDGVLAQQLLVLGPGRYRLTMRLAQVSGQPAALSWGILCFGSQSTVASMPIDAVAARGWSFEVPRNCPAQWLQLSGASADLPQQSDVTVSGLRLTADRAHD